MSKILIVAEHAAGKLNPSTAKCVSGARAIEGAEITIAVFSNDGSAVAAEAAQLAGVQRVLRVDNPANEHALAAVLAPQVAQLAGGFGYVLGPSTPFGKALMQRVAVLLAATQVRAVVG